MKYKFLIGVLIFFPSYTCLSQSFKGIIVNEEDGEPVPYVNVGILGKDVGTVSDVNGNFELSIDSKYLHDTLRISCIGFFSKSYQIKELSNSLSSKNNVVKVALKPRVYEINEVSVLSDRVKVKVLGNSLEKNDRDDKTTFSLPISAEYAIRIKGPKKNKKYKLKNFTVRLYKQDFETQIRINVYRIINSKPADNILQKPIYVQIPRNIDRIKIDLEKYNILVDEDFYLSIESIMESPSKDKTLKLIQTKVRNNYGCLTRKASQGNWSGIAYVVFQFKLNAYELDK